jgi:hypothetical protein
LLSGAGVPAGAIRQTALRRSRPFLAGIAALGLVALAAPASANCTVRVTIAQTGAHQVGFVNGNAVVRSRTHNRWIQAGILLPFTPPWGPWREMRRDSFLDQFAPGHVHRLSSGQSLSGHYFADLGCSVDREHRISFQCLTGIYAATNYLFATTVATRGPMPTTSVWINVGGACR